MTAWVALLRGVNVGGHRRVAMADLRQALTQQGARNVRTYLQSGNAVFDADGDRVPALVRAAVDTLGQSHDVVVRSGADLVALQERLPWPERAAADPALLQVGFLSAPAIGAARNLGPEEDVLFDGSEIWIWYGAGSGRSRLVLDVDDRVLTQRNWRTVAALSKLAAD